MKEPDAAEASNASIRRSHGILARHNPDSSQQFCDGGDAFFKPPPPYDQFLGPVIPCYFHSFGNRVYGNAFKGNGAFGNLTNGDLANAALDYPIRNCFFNNQKLRGTLTSAPINIEDPSVAGSCSGPWVTDPVQEPVLFLELLCDTFGPASGACLPGSVYPVTTGVTFLPIPREPGMPDSCAGVPSNSWCKDE